MNTLRARVKELRVSKGMTQQGLAERADVGLSLITALESGRRRYVSWEDVERLAKGLDVASEELWLTIPGGKREQRYILITESGRGEVARTA